MVKRRDFLKMGAAAAAAGPVFTDVDAQAHDTELTTLGGEGYSHPSGTERDAVPTTCAMCASRCAAIGYVENGYVVKVEGNPDSQRTMGVMCAKGQAGINQVYDPDRILQPLRRVGKRGEGKWEKISWESAAKASGKRYPGTTPSAT
jgi:anaerobic selenocysteine-containing dehydrogenase